MADSRKYADRSQYLKVAVAKRRARVRQMALERLGGRCQSCGYDKCQKALEFHRIDETEKGFGISAKGYTRSWKAVSREIDKCFLLCANCHGEVHAGVTQLLAEKRVEKWGELLETLTRFE